MQELKESGQGKDESGGMALYKGKGKMQVVVEDEDDIGEQRPERSGMRTDVSGHLGSHRHCIDTDVERCFADCNGEPAESPEQGCSSNGFRYPQ